jgi:murein DD-endopeptidase MepM/ murein hydrolase activator NlpD
MSSSRYYPHAEPSGRYAPVRAQSAAAVSRHVQRTHGDYTLVHGGRQVRIGPVAFWIVVGTLVVMGVWSIATGTYFAFSEDVLTRLIGRQAEMQFAYEDRIAELRATVDRITSRQLLDQEQFEKKLDILLKRQTSLESRTSALTGDTLTTGTIRPGRPTAPAKPSPLNESMDSTTPSDRAARLVNSGGLDGMLTRVGLSLDKVEQRQTATLTNLEETLNTKTQRIGSVLAELGIDAAKTPAGAGMGGPFVPARPPGPAANSFDRQLYRVSVARAQLNRYSHTLVNVPLRKPVMGDIDMSSPFGIRMDPFLKGPAIHTGVDLRSETGDPVSVTANGTVTIASWQGGYGNMVEVDHGNGLSTRYGHLSKIEVKVGEAVRIGQTIGRVGSTGRSTGPHLHYETRVDGEPVNPQKFLHAGTLLGIL